MIRSVCAIAIAAALPCLLVALTLWACPALAGDLAPEAAAVSPWVAWAAGGVSLASAVGWGVTWGRTRQQLADQDRRLGVVETCAARLTGIEATLAERREADTQRHADLVGRLERIEARLDGGRR
jgi:hypothetical protein